jgi:hypothetical protein
VTICAEIAEWATGLRLDDVPPDARERAGLQAMSIEAGRVAGEEAAALTRSGQLLDRAEHRGRLDRRPPHPGGALLSSLRGRLGGDGRASHRDPLTPQVSSFAALALSA